jgi:hypothetical protein
MDRMQFSKPDGFLYDVIAVSLGNKAENIEAGTILWIMERKTLPDAEAIEYMAIARQGVEDRYFTHIPTGTYKQGEIYEGIKQQL